MKRRITIWDKLRVCYKWLRNEDGKYSDGLTTICDFCKSTQIERTKSKTERIGEDKCRYIASYRCKKCDAIAIADEFWVKEGINDDEVWGFSVRSN